MERALVFETYLTTPRQKQGGQADGKVHLLSPYFKHLPGRQEDDNVCKVALFRTMI